MVVRYFGGIKLGVPGLIRAYKSAAADVLDHSEIVEKVASEGFGVTFDYMAMDRVMRVTRKWASPLEIYCGGSVQNGNEGEAQ